MILITLPKGEKMKAAKFAVICAVLMMSASAYAYDDGDFQVWHTESQELKINKVSKITFEEELRWGDDAGELYYQHYHSGYVYAVNKNLDLGVNYRQIYDKTGDKFKEENRPYINATVKWGISGFKFDDRNRLEYRHFDYREDLWRYRNKITAKFPFKFTKIEIQPYMADEVFISFLGRALSKNRAYCGFLMSFTPNLKGEIYYMLQSDKTASGKWKAANVLGTKLKLVF